MAATTAVPSIERAAKGVSSNAALTFLKKPKHLLIGGKWVPAQVWENLRNYKPG